MKHVRHKLVLAALASLWAMPLNAADAKHMLDRSQPTKETYVGLASWYGQRHQGKRMANGRRFDHAALSAACRRLPLGTRIRVFNLENGRFVDVTITDRGPSSRLRSRILDLSQAAAAQLGYVGKGTVKVFFTPLPEIKDVQLDYVKLDSTLEPQVAADTNVIAKPHQ